MIAIAIWVVSGWRRPPARPASTVLTASATAALPAEPVPIADSASIGSVDAPVAVILFSDFQCPFCQEFAEKVWPEFRRQCVDSGKVLFVFRHLPLSIHADAMSAAVAAHCATLQGRFLPMHDRLFTRPQRLTADALRDNAIRFSLDLHAYDQCVAGPGPAAVARDVEQAETWHVQGTPTFLMGRLGRDKKVRLSYRFGGSFPLPRLATVLKERFGI